VVTPVIFLQFNFGIILVLPITVFFFISQLISINMMLSSAKLLITILLNFKLVTYRTSFRTPASNARELMINCQLGDLPY
jgi:hypothetical protein